MQYIHVTVVPNARRESCAVQDNGTYVFAVKQKARGNQANERVLEMLAALLSISKKKLRIRTGHHGRKKLIEVLE